MTTDDKREEAAIAWLWKQVAINGDRIGPDDVITFFSGWDAASKASE